MNAFSGNVLVVDDDETVRRCYLRSLAATDCNVATVADGQEALREMERKPFDVVMLDLRLPGMDGLSVLKALKQRWPESEVVVITGYPSLETAKDAVRLGAYDYLAKPVGPTDVIKAASSAMLHKKWSLHCDRTGRSACA
ncbi:MAG TPA: response regulator [Casimicrobiaceae bacterium]|nr:response regulator [Casimicrobiaceae bacterium]